jgi:hypothetical protein
MTTPRSNFVKLRLTDLEKQDWTQAAGGARKLSAWIRQVCNEACAERAEQEAADLAAEKLHAARVPLSTPVKPVIVSDAIERSVQDETAQAIQPYKAQTPPAEQEASSGQCPRWMHHRPGVYCGTCKKVIGK